MQSDTDLFGSPATPSPAPKEAPSKSDAADIAFAGASKEQLPGTLNALKRIPEVVSKAVEATIPDAYQAAFKRLFEAEAARPVARPIVGSATMIAHSAKLEVFSTVEYVAGAPWHLADAALLQTIAREVKAKNDPMAAHRQLAALPCRNMFVAVRDEDDRESYLKAVAKMVKDHRIRDVVLDGAVIDWFPESEFLAACELVGMAPVHVGISDTEHATRHGMCFSRDGVSSTPVLFVDTLGRLMKPNADGILEAEVRSRPARVAAPVDEEPTAAELAPAVGVTPGAAMQSRISNLVSRQSGRVGNRTRPRA